MSFAIPIWTVMRIFKNPSFTGMSTRSAEHTPHHKMVLIQDDRLLGVCALFRPKTDQDFSRRDVYILNLIKSIWPSGFLSS